MAADKREREDRREVLEQRLLQLVGEMEAAGLIVHQQEKVREPKVLASANVNGARFVLFQVSREKVEPPTTRQKEILALLGKGLRNKGMAKRLGLSTETVRNQLKKIYRKLRVKTRAGAVLKWLWLKEI